MDEVTQYLRAYTESPKEKTSGRRTLTVIDTPGQEEQTILDANAPDPIWRLVFDTETTSDTAQQLRFGVYEVHGLAWNDQRRLYQYGLDEGDATRYLDRVRLDTIHERGIFYDPDVCTPDEVERIHQYAATHAIDTESSILMRCMDRESFVRDVFYPWVYDEGALCIGHNLPFDLARLAQKWTGARGKFYRGGFSFKLCSCLHHPCFYHPPLRIKHLGGIKDAFGFRSVTMKFGNKKPVTKRYAGKFLDTGTFGAAMIEPKGGPSLENMAKLFRTKDKKSPSGGHGQTITDQYLDYACTDVRVTWQLYQKERELYQRHALPTDPWMLYSSASLGKAYLKKLGVTPFMTQNPTFPRERLGQAMQGYYGGRTDIGIRHEPTEVLYCDFKSQYPTVNALMHLQDLLLTHHVSVRRCKTRVTKWLRTLTLKELQDPATWERLRCYVRVKADGDILPVRSNFGGEGVGTNIALPVVTSDEGVWYALPDVVASILLTGKVPEILEAWELIPSRKRIQTNHVPIFGDARYMLDLDRDDLFTRMIDLRTEIKGEMRGAVDEDQRYLDSLQVGLKLVANATSYGVLVEVNSSPRQQEKVPLLVAHDSVSEELCHIEETPGRYFAGPIGALIPSAGRLLLAIAERVGKENGLHYAFCDTDSFAYARSESMDRESFGRAVESVREWFQTLSPYNGAPDIFELENINSWENAPEPLYALCISPKRYVLYNRLPDGSYRIRKFSAHGTGSYLTPSDYTPDPAIPEPCKDAQDSGPPWLYDFWYGAVQEFERGVVPSTIATGHGEEYFNSATLHRVTISTYPLLKMYEKIPNIRPYNFITVLPGISGDAMAYKEEVRLQRITSRGQTLCNDLVTELRTLNPGTTFYASFGKSLDEIGGTIRRSDTHELVRADIPHLKLKEALVGYFKHPDVKAADENGQGRMERRTVHVVGKRYIGKEADAIILDLIEESGGAIPVEDAQIFVEAKRAQGLAAYSTTEIAEGARLSIRTASNAKSGAPLSRRTLAKIDHWLATKATHATRPRRSLKASPKIAPKAPPKSDKYGNRLLYGDDLRAALQPYSKSAIARASGVPRKTVTDFMRGATPKNATREKLASVHRVLRNESPARATVA